MMPRRMARAVTAALMGITLAGMLGCGSNAQNDPFIIEKFKDVESQLTKVRNLPDRVQQVSDDVDALTVEIDNLKSKGGAAVPAALAKEVQDIKVTVQALNKNLTDLQAKVAGLEKAVQGLGAKQPTPVRLAPTPPGTAPKTPAPGTPKPGVTPPPKEAQPTPAAKGQYYTAAQGDTIESVAKKFNITGEALIKANTYLKPGTPLLPGQSYWIPVPPK